jgi:hypothetical protein
LFPANPLPLPVQNGTVVHHRDSFFLVGGWTTGYLELSTIFHYNPKEDTWTLLDSRFNHRLGHVITFMVDRNMFENK